MKKVLPVLSIIIVLGVFLGACSTSAPNNGGRFLPGDGLPAHRVDIAAVPNATPKDEPLSATGNKPYQVYGKSYTPLHNAIDYQAQGVASWYGTKFHGKRTSSGEPYDMYAMSAAHRTLPLPSYVRVTNMANQRSVIVKVNDRGPFVNTATRIIDLSYVAAAKLGVVETGTGKVHLETIGPVATVSTATPERSVQANEPVVTDSQAMVDNESIQTSPLPAANAQSPASSDTQTSFIQMGAFSVRYNAEQLVQKLSQIGVSSKMVQADGFFKVISGPITDPDQALRQKLEIDRLLNIQTRIIFQ